MRRRWPRRRGRWPDPHVCVTNWHWVTDQWVPLVRFDLDLAVDSLTSRWRQADAVIHFLDLKLTRKFQKMFQTSKNHRNSTVAQIEIIYIWKIIRKIQSIHLYHFHAWQTNLYMLYIWKHTYGIFKSLFWSCIWTFGSNGLQPNEC